jgi:hypothetical protein
VWYNIVTKWGSVASFAARLGSLETPAAQNKVIQQESG